jgi:hypothetical protein
VGKFRQRWLEDIENDLQELKVKWRQRANGKEERAPAVKGTAKPKSEKEGKVVFVLT